MGTMVLHALQEWVQQLQDQRKPLEFGSQVSEYIGGKGQGIWQEVSTAILVQLRS